MFSCYLCNRCTVCHTNDKLCHKSTSGHLFTSTIVGFWVVHHSPTNKRIQIMVIVKPSTTFTTSSSLNLVFSCFQNGYFINCLFKRSNKSILARQNVKQRMENIEYYPKHTEEEFAIFKTENENTLKIVSIDRLTEIDNPNVQIQSFNSKLKCNDTATKGWMMTMMMERKNAISIRSEVIPCYINQQQCFLFISLSCSPSLCACEIESQWSFSYILQNDCGMSDSWPCNTFIIKIIWQKKMRK